MASDNNESLLTAEHVSVIRRGRHILDNVSLTVREREFLTVVGPNGAGKTILLHTLMQLIRPDKGTVIRRPALKIGYMPQRFAPEATLPLTVEHFLMLVKGASKNHVADTLAQVDATELAQKPIHILSGGELQRILLARALLHKPDLLVLDEPAQNLDVGGQLAFYKLLENVYRTHECAIVMVSHDLHMVLASSSRVICLYHHICCSGAPDAVAKDPEFAALFGNDMTQIMSVYHHHHAHNHSHDHEH